MTDPLVTALHLVRHAPTHANRDGIFQGQRDVPAAPVEDPERHRLRPGGPVRLLSSPLQRARAGAALLLPGVEPTIDPRLTERSVGAWEGLDHATVQERWPASYVDGAIDPFVTPPDGESMHTLCARVLDFLSDLVETTDDRPTYLVTHNGWIRAARLVNGELSAATLFADSEPFLVPLLFRPAPERWHNPFPAD